MWQVEISNQIRLLRSRIFMIHLFFIIFLSMSALFLHKSWLHLHKFLQFIPALAQEQLVFNETGFFTVHVQLIHLRILSNTTYYVALISGGTFELLFHKAHWKWARRIFSCKISFVGVNKQSLTELVTIPLLIFLL